MQGTTSPCRATSIPLHSSLREDLLKQRVKDVLDAAGNRNGHIFNLGHGIVPGTPVDAVINVAKWVKELSAR